MQTYAEQVYALLSDTPKSAKELILALDSTASQNTTANVHNALHGLLTKGLMERKRVSFLAKDGIPQKHYVYTKKANGTVPVFRVAPTKKEKKPSEPVVIFKLPKRKLKLTLSEMEELRKLLRI